MANTLSDLLRSRRNVGFSGMNGDLLNENADQNWQPQSKPITNESLGYQPYPTSKPQNNYSQPQESNQSSNAISMMMMANQGGNRPEYTTRQLGSHEQNWDYGVKDQYGMSDINRSQQVNVGDGMVGYVQPDGRVIAQDNSGAYFEATSNANQNRMFQGLQQSMQAKLERDYQQALKREDEQRNQQAAGGKLQFNAEAGGFIEPPSAQYPQGRIIPIPGFKPKGTGKPLPTQALKLQQEELDAIGSASALNADLSQFKKMIDSGKLPLGMTSNWAAEAKNYTGMSDEGSRNYASFKANLERLRNESLRLNKGVQTEGDAIRAWNEIVKNINDPKLVSQRLGEVAKTNERGIALRKMNVDAIRSNYGKDPMDVTGRENVQSAYETDDAQAIAWAQSNPNDPRAAQIMSLHGR